MLCAHIYTAGAKIYSCEDAKDYMHAISNKTYIALFHLYGNEYKYTSISEDKHAITLDENDKIWTNITYKNLDVNIL